MNKMIKQVSEVIDETMVNVDALQLPGFVVERLDWASKVIKDDGITPVGAVEIAMAKGDTSVKEDFEFGSSHEWLEPTAEFIVWRNQSYRTAELLIMAALFFVPYKKEEDDE